MILLEEVDINKKNIIIILSIVITLIISIYLFYSYYNRAFIPKIISLSNESGYISDQEAEGCDKKDCLLVVVEKVNTGLVIELNIIGEDNGQYNKNISNIKAALLSENYRSTYNSLTKIINDKNSKVSSYLASNRDNFIKIKKYILDLGYNPKNYIINGEYAVVTISGGDGEDGNILLKKTAAWNILRGPYTYLDDLEPIKNNSIIISNINNIYDKPILNYFSEENFISGLIETINIINYEKNASSISNILPYSDEGFDIQMKNEDVLFVTIYANNEETYKTNKTNADKWISLNKNYIKNLQVEYFRESAADVE